MSRLTQAEIRNNAIAFVHKWKDETCERTESQTFWNEFLNIFGGNVGKLAFVEKVRERTRLTSFAHSFINVERKPTAQAYQC